ncbi:MAG: hypothetical protein AAF598_01665, partial [Bacteroidota bacterium]
MKRFNFIFNLCITIKLIVIFWLISSSMLYSQNQAVPESPFNTSAENEINYFEYTEQMDAYLDTANNADPLFEKEYGRWKAYWQSRVSESGSINTSDNIRFQEWSSDPPTNVCNTGYGQWVQQQNISPTAPQVNGRVDVVYQTQNDPNADPNDPAPIFMGGHVSGLWKSIYDEITGEIIEWENITDRLRFPTLGITDMVEHNEENPYYDPTISDPNDPNSKQYHNVYYIGTGRAAGEQGRGVGILKYNLTTDELSVFHEWSPSFGDIISKIKIVPTPSGSGYTFYAIGKQKIYRVLNLNANSTNVEVVNPPSSINPFVANGTQFCGPFNVLDSILPPGEVQCSNGFGGYYCGEHYIDLEVLPSSPNDLFISTSYKSFKSGRVYHSPDGGITWELIQPLNPSNPSQVIVSDVIVLATSEAAPNSIFARVRQNNATGPNTSTRFPIFRYDVDIQNPNNNAWTLEADGIFFAD